jgi:hypothetical protein
VKRYPKDANVEYDQLVFTSLPRKIVTDREVWRFASMLLQVYGYDAVFVAGSRADDAVKRREPDAVVLWLRIMEKADELQRTERLGELLH